MRRMALLLLLAAAAPAYAAGVYKWVDEQGRVHYGERPPAAVKQAKEMVLEQAPPPDPYAAERHERMKGYLDASQEERADREAEKAKEQADKEQGKRNCTAAKNRMRMYNEAGVIFSRDEAGERHYLSDAQRAAERQNTEAQVAKWCR